jgi:hypothetical protein
MRIYSLSVILGEDNTISLHTNFQLVVNEINTILAESDPKYKEALKAWIQTVFDRTDISADTIGSYLGSDSARMVLISLTTNWKLVCSEIVLSSPRMTDRL